MTNATEAMKVVAWLKSLPQVTAATPIRVVIGHGKAAQIYYGARYCQALEHNGKPYTSKTMYLIGELPRVYRKRRKTCFTMLTDSREWYVAGYMPRERLTPATAQYNPFGMNFLLKPWELSEMIDAHEKHKYTRVNLDVEYLLA